MTAGTVNVYIPLRADNGERSTGIVPKGSRKRATFMRSVDVRTFFDPLADRNLPNAIPTTDPRHPSRTAHEVLGNVAPKGWRFRPVMPVEPVAVPVSPIDRTSTAHRPRKCPRCSRSDFRTSNGLAWHVDRCDSANRRSA